MTAEIQDRYEVQPVGPVFVIRDMAMGAFCSLDGKAVLEWPERTDASQWLARCYRAWGFNPNITEDPNDPKAKGRYMLYNPAESPWLTDWHDQ